MSSLIRNSSRRRKPFAEAFSRPVGIGLLAVRLPCAPGNRGQKPEIDVHRLEGLSVRAARDGAVPVDRVEAEVDRVARSSGKPAGEAQIVRAGADGVALARPDPVNAARRRQRPREVRVRRRRFVLERLTDRSKSTLIYGLTFQGEASDQRRDVSIER